MPISIFLLPGINRKSSQVGNWIELFEAPEGWKGQRNFEWMIGGECTCILNVDVNESLHGSWLLLMKKTYLGSISKEFLLAFLERITRFVTALTFMTSGSACVHTQEFTHFALIPIYLVLPRLGSQDTRFTLPLPGASHRHSTLT